MLPIFGGRRARYLESGPPCTPLPLPQPSGDQLVRRDGAVYSLDLVAIQNARIPRRRRRNRSRNCRNFRQFRPFFHLTERRQHAQLQEQLEAAHRRVQQLLAAQDLAESRRINARDYAIEYATDMARRFYDHFGHGFDPVNCPAQSSEAEAFLQSAMRSDVVCNEFAGIDMFLEQYRTATANHGSMALSLKRIVLLDNGDDAVQVLAEATARFRITRVTLERLFPDIVQDEALTQRLIGKEYEVQYDKVFHFADGRIYQHESRVDLCSSLLQMVGDPFLALKLFQASLLTKQGHYRLGDVAENRHELENVLL